MVDLGGVDAKWECVTCGEQWHKNNT